MLADIIPLISAMHYDELKDWIDFVEFKYFASLVPDDERDTFYKQVRNRRIGQPTGAFSYGDYKAKNELTMTSKAQKDALKAYRTLSGAESIALLGKPSASRDTNEAIAWVLLKSKMSVRKNSQGNIQVKWISYQYTERDETGKPMTDENGKPLPPVTVHAPYLYLRYYQVHGDDSKTKKRYKSIYIGGDADFETRIANFRPNDEYNYPYRPLAELFHATLQEYGIEQKRTIKSTGEIQTYKTRPKGDDNPIAQLEQRIIACIDINTVDSIGKQAIKHEKLIELQSELCP